MPNGWIVTLAALWPNLLWMLFPPRETSGSGRRASAWLTGLLEGLERIGRIGLFVVPLFYRIEISGPLEKICAGGMVLALTVYYAGWARYYLRGRDRSLLYKALLKIPIPLAVSPVVYFGAASVVLHSAVLAVVVALFGLSHIPLSHRESRRLRA